MTESREARYAEAIKPIVTDGTDHDHAAVIRAVMAVTNEEHAELSAEVERLREEVSWHDRHATVIEAMLADAQARALAAAEPRARGGAPTLDEIDPRLIKALRPLVARYGDEGVKRTVGLLRARATESPAEVQS